MKIIEYPDEDIVVSIDPKGICTLITKYGRVRCIEKILPMYIKKYAKVNDHMCPYPFFYGIFPYRINSKCVVYLKNPLPNSTGKHNAKLVPKGMPYNKQAVIETGYLTIYEDSLILPYNIKYTPTNLERIIYKHARGINRHDIR